MNRIKRMMIVVMAIFLVLPSFLVNAESDNSKKSHVTAQEGGEFTSKDEVVYATLSATGDRQEIYVVNTFDVTKAGKLVDYGTYSSLKNLTNLSEIKQVDSRVHLTVPEGKFYYQGNMNSEPLPWDIAISYLLNGEAITPEELLGKDGHVEINIHTAAHEQVDSIFFENYLLQISLTLDPTIYSNIKVPGGMRANAGKNKQITFTIMPEKEGNLTLEADVIDFELDGIDITAVPSSMSIDAPDIDEMTGDIKSLTDAIKEINNGVAELNDGVYELNDGVINLRNGSGEYKDGISQIDESSAELVDASLSIDEALATMSKSLRENSDQMDLSGFKELSEGLMEIANGLEQTSDGLDLLRKNYTSAYSTLDKAMMAIPEHEITEEEIQSLYKSGADRAIVDQLIETYSAARTAKGTYSAVKEAFDAVDPTLTEVSGSIKEMSKALHSMATELDASLAGMNSTDSFAQLQEGLATLSSNYNEFHSGLVSYTDGVGHLSISYHDLHAGIVDLSEGTVKLEDGVNKLHNGTKELYESTDDLPDQMREEVDKMIADFDKSDFKPVSFVSPKNNEKINIVQFVIKTESIVKDELKTEKELEKEQSEENGFIAFWNRLLALFSKNES